MCLGTSHEEVINVIICNSKEAFNYHPYSFQFKLIPYSCDVPKHINILYDKKCHGTDEPEGRVCPMTFFIIQDINEFGNVK